MIIQKSINIPANTLLSDIISTDIKLSKGLIYQLDIYFPPGSCGLAGICIFSNEVQLYPNEIGEYFTGDNNLISFPDTEIIKEPPYILNVEGYNIDTVYDHKIIIRVGFVAEDKLILRYLPESINTIIKKIDENNAIKEEKKKEERSKLIKRRVK